MKIAHSVFIRVLENEIDFNTDNFVNLLKLLLPESLIQIFEEENKENILKKLEKEKCDFEIEEIKSKDALKVSSSKAELIDGVDLVRVDFSIKKEKNINEFIQNLKSKLGKNNLQKIISEANRVDDDCNLYIRLDKKELDKGNFILTDNGDCFHIKIKLAAYPNKKENALKIVNEIFKIN